MTRTRLGRVGLALVLVASSGVALSEGAAAANCGKAKERYHVLEYDTDQAFAGKEFVSQPGEREVSASLDEALTFTTRIHGTVGAEAKKVWGGISVQLGAEAVWTRTTERGFSEKRQVPADKYGHLKFWNEIWHTRWLKYLDFERCPHEYVDEGKADVVADKVGFAYWTSDDGHGEPPKMQSRHYDGGEPQEGTPT
jgi:hypothetical protein